MTFRALCIPVRLKRKKNYNKVYGNTALSQVFVVILHYQIFVIEAE